MVLYTAVGGLKATFLTDFLHTAVALVLIIYFTLAVLIHPAVGGLYGLWDKVQATAGGDNYIPTNYQGSLLTMKSQDGVIWGLIVKFGNLALVVMVSKRVRPTRVLPRRPPSADCPANRILRSGKSPLQAKFGPPFRDTTWRR